MFVFRIILFTVIAFLFFMQYIVFSAGQWSEFRHSCLVTWSIFFASADNICQYPKFQSQAIHIIYNVVLVWFSLNWDCLIGFGLRNFQKDNSRILDLEGPLRSFSVFPTQYNDLFHSIPASGHHPLTPNTSRDRALTVDKQFIPLLDTDDEGQKASWRQSISWHTATSPQPPLLDGKVLTFFQGISQLS